MFRQNPFRSIVFQLSLTFRFNDCQATAPGFRPAAWGLGGQRYRNRPRTTRPTSITSRFYPEDLLIRLRFRSSCYLTPADLLSDSGLHVI